MAAQDGKEKKAGSAVSSSASSEHSAPANKPKLREVSGPDA